MYLYIVQHVLPIILFRRLLRLDKTKTRGINTEFLWDYNLGRINFMYKKENGMVTWSGVIEGQDVKVGDTVNTLIQ